jgi:hypothetical protein
MSRKLYLHIGLAKAGSTSIQAALYAKRGALLRNGILYPALGPNHSRALLLAFAAAKPDRVKVGGRTTRAPYDRDFVARFRAGIERQVAEGPHHTCILSGEMLPQLGLAGCHDLRRAFERAFDEIRVVAYVRHPVAFANSRAPFDLQQRRHTLEALTGRLLLPGSGGRLVPRYRQIQPFIDVFGRDAVDIRVFEPLYFAGGDLLADFADAVGLPPRLAPTLAGAWKKRAQSAESIHILNRYVRQNGAAAGARFHSLRRALGALRGSRFSLREADLKRVWRRTERELDWLHGVLGREVFRETYPATAFADPSWSGAAVDDLERLAGPGLALRPGTPLTVTALDRVCARLERALPADAKAVGRATTSPFDALVMAVAGLITRDYVAVA